MKNIYQPELMEVASVQRHTADVKSVKVRFRDADRAQQFQFRVGQFGIFSAWGYGESVFNICSSSTWNDGLEFCFRKTGRVTEALWEIEEGDPIGFRGPYGNGYPVEAWKGKNLIFLGGGIAMPPIRCAIWYALENRADYGDITIVYGARTVADLVYVNELDEWAKRERVHVIRCVDPGGETPDWTGEIGFVPTVFERAQIAAGDSVALVIGPPIMIKNTMPVLDRIGLLPGSIYTSLENRMKCGVGKCGRCNCALSTSARKVQSSLWKNWLPYRKTTN
jgi:sulfhydrogenase subunit gamma (sulfur reductase)